MTKKDLLGFIKDNVDAIVDGEITLTINFAGDTVENFGITFDKPIQGFTNNRHFANNMVQTSIEASNIVAVVIEKRGKGKDEGKEAKKDGDG